VDVNTKSLNKNFKKASLIDFLEYHEIIV